MAQVPAVTIEGKRIGRFRASWLLFKETWRFLRLDPEIVLITFVAGLANFFVILTLLGVGTLVHFFGVPLVEMEVVDGMFGTTEEELSVAHPLAYLFLFLLYVSAAFILAFSQGAIAYTVITRLRGGDATFKESASVALRHWQPILFWSIITATIGVLLQAIAERLKFVGRFVIGLIGVSWEVVTYFVAPAIVIQDMDAISAIKQSGKTLRQTFGETVMTNIGLGAVFLLVYVVAIIFFIFFVIGGSMLLGLTGFVICLAISLTAVLAIGLLQASLQGILKTLLYAYVMEHNHSLNFNEELLKNVLVRSNNQESTSTTINPSSTI